MKSRRSLYAALLLVFLSVEATPAQTLQALLADVKAGRATPEDKLLLAKTYISAKSYVQAQAVLAALTFSDAQHKVTQLILQGLCAEGLVQNARAAALYAQAVQVSPTRPDAYLRRGVLAYLSGNTSDARLMLQKSVSLAPNSPEAYYYLFRLATTSADRASTLNLLLACDGPDGAWSAKALAHR